MNVIVANRYSAMLSSLSTKIDLIKTIDGEFQVEELIAQFDNFFFNKMVLDITAISGYQDITQIQKLSFGMDVSKIILLLDDSPIVNSEQYLSELVSMGIYNFTRNIDGIAYLIDNPNVYKDVAQFHMIGMSGGQNQNNFQQDYNNRGNGGNKGMFGFNQTTGNERGFMSQGMSVPMIGGTRVIGIKNLTEHAGATSLIYMLKKQLSENYRVLGIELDKNDFLFFNDPDMKSISSKEFQSVVNNPVNNYNVILVDVNDSAEGANCSEMLYLIQPTTLKLKKLTYRDRNIKNKMKSMKIILNQSSLDATDVRDFEKDAETSVFFNLGSLDDTKDKHRSIDELLNKLGFDKNRPTPITNKSARLFGIVKE